MWCEMICTFGNDHVWSWPQKWMDEGPEAYAENYMEKPGSVHLSPAWHRWNYESNMPNEALAKEYE